MIKDIQFHKKKILVDGILNIIAAGLPILIIQLIVFPIFGKYESTEFYGFIVTMYAIMMFIPNISGNALANLRLVKENEYQDKKGDFNIIVLYYLLINILILIGITLLLYDNLIEAIIFIVTCSLTFLNAYYEVAFSIQLNFRYRLYVRIYLIVGYIVGLIAYFWTNYWECIFLFGQITTSVFILWKSKLYMEGISRSDEYKNTNTDAFLLVIASILSSSINYLDRIILFPMLGAGMVAIYNIATLVGKIVLMITPPINSLMLSYISRLTSLKKSIAIKLIGIMSFICICIFMLCICISEWILSILYPQYAAQAIAYVPIMSLAATISALTGMIQIFVMKFCKIKWQTIMNLITVIFYLCMTAILTYKLSLLGFCIGVVLSNILSLIVALVVLFKNLE